MSQTAADLTGAQKSPRLRTSVRARHGRMFQPADERRLIPQARRAIALLGGESSVLALAEFNAPFGVPDFTAVVGGQPERTKRLRSGIPALLNEIDAGIVAAASATTPRSAKHLAHLLRWPLEAVQRRLPSLLGTRAIIEPAVGRYTSTPAIKPWGTTYAVEMKVSDWRKGLKQCRRYGLWADGYFLVLASVPAASREQLLAEVVSDSGGLLVGGEVLSMPRPRSLRRSRRLWAIEHVVAELQTQQSR
jgi:hypothetical protein